MRGKLIPGSAGITQILYAQGFCLRTFYNWSRFSFSNSRLVPHVKNTYLRYNVYTSKRFDLACSVKSIPPVEEDIFLELKKLMKMRLLKRKDVDKALLNTASYKDENNSLLVLKCISKLPDISPENRVALSRKFLTEVKSVGGVVTEAHCIQVLECYLQSKYFKNLDSFLSTIKDYGVNHTNKIKLMVLKCLCEEGAEEKYLALAQELENSDCNNVEELNAAKLYNLALSGGIEEALEEIKQMKEKNVTIGSNIYASLLKAVVLKGEKHFIEHLTKDVLLQGIVFSDDQILEILENVALAKRCDLIPNVKLLCVDDVLLRISHILLVKLLHNNKINSAYAFMNYLFSLNYICETGDKEILLNRICKSFIEESSALNCPVNDLIKRCHELKKLNKCLYSLEYALYCCLRKADVRGSLTIFRVMFSENLSLEPHYFWPLLIILKEKFGDEGIIFVLDKMVELQVPFNPETLTDYIFPNMSRLNLVEDILEKVNMVEAQQELFKEVFLLYTIKNELFKECLEFLTKHPGRGDRTYTFLDNHLMEAMLKNSKCKEIVILAEKTNTVDPFSAILKLWSRNDLEEIQRLSKYFNKFGMFTKNVEEAKEFVEQNKDYPFMQKVVLGLINERAAEPKTDRDSFITKKPSRFDFLKELERGEVILAELKAKNLNTISQRLRLMRMYIENQMYDKAVRAKKEVLELMGKNQDFSPGYLIMLARLSAYEGDMDGALNYFNILREKYPNFSVSSVKGLTLCLYFMQNDRYNEMLSVLRGLKKWDGKVENISSISVQVLRQVARLGLPELTDLVFKILLQKKFIEVDVNSLQVYTMSYLHAKDLTGAVKEYERVAAVHGLFCSTRPILWSAVQAGRLDLAERVISLSSGKSVNKSYLLSFLVMIASTGDLEVLMSYSEKLKFPLDNDFMIQKFFEGKIPSCPSTAFTTLIAAAIKRKLPYDHFVEGAIKSIIKKKDHEEATDFLNFCESNKIAMSEDQVSLLRLHVELGEIDAASKILMIKGGNS